MKINLRFLILSVLIWHQIGITWGQNTIKKIIEQTDEIYESQIAFDRLDSIYKNAEVQPKTKILLLQKLVQRSLEINDYSRLTKFSIEGIDLSRKYHKDSSEAHFFKSLGISQIYSQKPEQAIETWKKKC